MSHSVFARDHNHQDGGAKDSGPQTSGGIGADLRSLRKMRGLTLVQLSQRINRSVGWISQVERGKTDPGISELKQLATTFDVPVSFFFRHDEAPAAEHGLIARCGARSAIGSDEDGLREELLSPDLNGSFEMIRCEFAPGAQRPLMLPRPTEDGGYVVSGQLEMTIKDKTFLLSAGDSFQFHKQAYGWRNPGDTAAVVLWIISPPIY